MPVVIGKTQEQLPDDSFRRALISSIVVEDRNDTLVRKIYSSLNSSTAIRLFESGSVALYSIAHDYIKKHISEPEVLDKIISLLELKSTGTIPLLRSLACIELPPSEQLKEALIILANSDETVLSEFATKVISIRYPTLAWEIVGHMNTGIRFGLCYSQEPKLIPYLIDSWGRENVIKHPPTALGLLVNAPALADIWQNDFELGSSLARAYGFIDDTLDAPSKEEAKALCTYLARDFLVVDSSYLSHDIDLLRSKEVSLIRCLQPWSTQDHAPNYQEISINDRASKYLLLSALRSVEKTNFLDKINEKPHTERGRENQKWIEFSYSPFSYSQRELLTKPSIEFSKLNLSKDLFTQYVLEYATCRLERDSQLQDEQLLFFESRWAHAGRFNKSPIAITQYPFTDENPYNELAELVIGSLPKRTYRSLDPQAVGALSTGQLLLYAKKPEAIPVLEHLEASQKSILPTIGIEIQCPFAKERRSESIAWKQALRVFGIPSPRRPEYRAMVEAAFGPAFSYHSHVSSLLLLKELGLFKQGQDLALHVSLGGNLGEDVRYLLFAQQFISPSSKTPPGRKLMSKGFAHLHDDAINPYKTKNDAISHQRTELRSMRINIEQMLSEKFPHFIDDIITFHLLGGALASSNRSMQELWASFKTEVTTLAESHPSIFLDLLNADWFERSGDSSDERLMPLLDIVDKRNQVKAWLKETNNEESARAAFRDIRDRHARMIFEILPKGDVYQKYESHFAKSLAGIPFLNPLREAEIS